MKISEIFQSIQGEGKLTGVPSVFVRCSGCNLRCVWCDTPYTSWNPEGANRSIDSIVSEVRQLGSRHVVVTGGEPLIMPDIVELCAALHDDGKHITVETAGTVFVTLSMHLASVSPKLSNSTPHLRESGRFAATHDRLRINVPVIQQFIDSSPDCQLKFVVCSEHDLVEIHSLLAQLHGFERDDVMLMPEGTDAVTLRSRAPWLAEACKREGFRFCSRLHVELWGSRRGV